jgi:hypothetical protein
MSSPFYNDLSLSTSLLAKPTMLSGQAECAGLSTNALLHYSHQLNLLRQTSAPPSNWNASTQASGIPVSMMHSIAEKAAINDLLERNRMNSISQLLQNSGTPSLDYLKVLDSKQTTPALLSKALQQHIGYGNLDPLCKLNMEGNLKVIVKKDSLLTTCLQSHHPTLLTIWPFSRNFSWSRV